MVVAGPVRVRRLAAGLWKPVAGDRLGHLGEPAEFAGQVVVISSGTAVGRVPAGQQVVSSAVQGSTDIGRFDRGCAPPVGKSDGISLVAVFAGIGGIAVRV